MKREYRAKTHIHINVIMPNGTNRHVSFLPQSDGSSVLVTTDKELQAALERHDRYGKLFKAINVAPQTAERTIPKPSELFKSAIEDEAEGKAEEETEAESEMLTVTVTDREMAKEYLADRFGISRSKLKTKAAIEQAALQKGIIFEGL